MQRKPCREEQGGYQETVMDKRIRESIEAVAIYLGITALLGLVAAAGLLALGLLDS